MELRLKLKPFQQAFLYSMAKFPALVGGWGTGKTLFALTRAVLYSEQIPDNLGVIFRKTFRSLQDSTLKDFERYTQRPVSSNREVKFPNGSSILFRHLDEIDSINQQNINLGWFYIEQADELDSDREFFMLMGRLRRPVKLSPLMSDLQLADHSGWIVANACDNWIRDLWKTKSLDDSELHEATTWDNADNLPKDYLETLRILERTKPEMYRRYVLNDWAVGGDQFVLIKRAAVDGLERISKGLKVTKRIIACDPATGGDECVIYVMNNTEIIDTLILHYQDTMKIVGELMILSHRYATDNFVVDSIGIGKGICDRLRELGKRVQDLNSASESSDPSRWYNLRAEMWWHAMEEIGDGNVVYPKDDELRKELSSVRYKVVNSNGRIQLHPKLETKKILGRSPDRADAFIYGLWGLQFVESVNPVKDRWAKDRNQGIASVTSMMAA